MIRFFLLIFLELRMGVLIFLSVYIYIDGHTTENIIYRWLTNKTETTVFKNEIVIPQFRIEKIAISSTVGHYTVGECHSSVFN
jgi:hypothetical protein